MARPSECRCSRNFSCAHCLSNRKPPVWTDLTPAQRAEMHWGPAGPATGAFGPAGTADLVRRAQGHIPYEDPRQG